MAIYHLDHSYLNWRAIPCKENDLYLCSFSSFSQHFFWLSWFSFRLNLNFSSAWHDTQFFFCSFFHFFHSHDLSTPGNDARHRWPFKSKHLFSCEDYFEKVGLLVWGCSYHFCPKKDRAQKYFFEKWVIFGQCALRHQSRWFSSITILGFCFAHWKDLADLKL